MSSAMSCGSISGRVTSTVLTSMCRWVSFSSSLVSLSIFSPFLPMIAPTRLRDDDDRHPLAGPLDRIFGDAGRCSFRSFLLVRYFWMNARILTSSTSSSEKSCLLAYHVLRQSVHDAGAEAGRPDFLTHDRDPSSLSVPSNNSGAGRSPAPDRSVSTRHAVGVGRRGRFARRRRPASAVASSGRTASR